MEEHRALEWRAPLATATECAGKRRVMACREMCLACEASGPVSAFARARRTGPGSGIANWRAKDWCLLSLWLFDREISGRRPKMPSSSCYTLVSSIATGKV